ncbi:hypothetical protein GHK80_16825 [Sinorhizobium medicae]|nr:hypothetical protein [Sinorhizobium medicae]
MSSRQSGSGRATNSTCWWIRTSSFQPRIGTRRSFLPRKDQRKRLNHGGSIQSCVVRFYLLIVNFSVAQSCVPLYFGAVAPCAKGNGIHDCNLVAFIPSLEGGRELNQWFERLTEQVAIAHDEAVVKATLEKLSLEAGFGAYAYLNLQAETQTAISNYDVDWQQRYFEKSYA